MKKSTARIVCPNSQLLREHGHTQQQNAPPRKLQDRGGGFTIKENNRNDSFCYTRKGPQNVQKPFMNSQEKICFQNWLTETTFSLERDKRETSAAIHFCQLSWQACRSINVMTVVNLCLSVIACPRRIPVAVLVANVWCRIHMLAWRTHMYICTEVYNHGCWPTCDGWVFWRVGITSCSFVNSSSSVSAPAVFCSRLVTSSRTLRASGRVPHSARRTASSWPNRDSCLWGTNCSGCAALPRNRSFQFKSASCGSESSTLSLSAHVSLTPAGFESDDTSCSLPPSSASGMAPGFSGNFGDGYLPSAVIRNSSPFSMSFVLQWHSSLIASSCSSSILISFIFSLQTPIVN